MPPVAIALKATEIMSLVSGGQVMAGIVVLPTDAGRSRWRAIRRELSASSTQRAELLPDRTLLWLVSLGQDRTVQHI
jgi:hypothetical protein